MAYSIDTLRFISKYTQNAFYFSTPYSFDDPGDKAVMIPTSAYEDWEAMQNTESADWDEIFAALCEHTSEIDLGILGHQLSAFSAIFLQVMRERKTHERFVHPLQYTLYNQPKEYDVLSDIYEGIGNNFDLFAQPDFQSLAWAALQAWRTQQNFYYPVRMGRQYTHGEHMLYTKDYRESIWHDPENTGITPALVSLQKNIGEVSKEFAKSSKNYDLLVETACNLYITTSSASLMSWVRTDRMWINLDTGAVIVVNDKYSTPPDSLDDYSHIEWVQIALEAMAASELASKIIRNGSRRTKQYSSPPFSRVLLDDLDTYTNNLTIFHQFPNVRVGNSFLVKNVTPSQERLESIRYTFNVIAQDLKPLHRRAALYEHLHTKKARLSMITPKTERQTNFPVQALISGLLSFDRASR